MAMTPPPPPSQPQPAPPPAGGIVKASWGRRLVAFIIDGIIVAAFSIPALVIFATGPTELTDCVDGVGLCEQPTAGTALISGLLYLVAFVAGVAYFAKLHSSATGQTVGKKVMDIRVVDVRTGLPISLGMGIGRYFGTFLSAIPCYLGFFWPLWDEKGQAFHDKVANTVVVPSTVYPPGITGSGPAAGQGYVGPQDTPPPPANPYS